MPSRFPHTLSSIFPELVGGLAATGMAILQGLSSSGIPKQPRDWVGAVLRVILAAVWGSVIGGLLTGLGHGDPNLIYAASGISGWVGTETTLRVIKLILAKLLYIDEKE